MSHISTLIPLWCIPHCIRYNAFLSYHTFFYFPIYHIDYFLTNFLLYFLNFNYKYYIFYMLNHNLLACTAILHGIWLMYQHGIAKGKETIALFYRFLICRQHMLSSSKSRYQHQQCRFRQMEIRDQTI